MNKILIVLAISLLLIAGSFIYIYDDYKKCSDENIRKKIFRLTSPHTEAEIQALIPYVREAEGCNG